MNNPTPHPEPNQTPHPEPNATPSSNSPVAQNVGPGPSPDAVPNPYAYQASRTNPYPNVNSYSNPAAGSSPISNTLGKTSGILGKIANELIQGTGQPVTSRIRPFGVTILSFWIGLRGFLYGLLLLFALGLYSFLSQFTPPPVTDPTGLGAGSGYAPTPNPASIISSLIPQPNVLSTLFLFILLAGLTIAYITFARGLFLVKSWAYWGTVAVEALYILITLIGFIGSHNQLGFITTVFLPALTLIYLLIPSVRKSFP